MAIASKAIERTALKNVTGKDGTTTSLGILQDARNRAGTTNELYNQVVQNRTLLNTQIQQANTTFENTLQTTQDNIYAAQRQAKARQAALGYVGQLAAAQTADDLQRQINSQLSSLLNQSETGAISIAGQQSQLNQAEIQALTSEIADAYVQDYGVKDDVQLVKKDQLKYTGNIILGILGGALAGGVSGGLVSSGVKSGSIMKSTLGLAGILGGGGLAGGSILQNSSNFNSTNTPEGQQAGLIAGLTGLGGALGLGALAKFSTGVRSGLGNMFRITAKNVKNGYVKNSLRASLGSAEELATNADIGALKNGAQVLFGAENTATKSGLFGKLGGLFTRGGLFPYATAAIGATLGGALAARTMPYYADQEAISNDAIAKAFADMGYSMDNFYDAGNNYTTQV